MADWRLYRKRLAVGWKAVRCWLWPYAKSVALNGRLRPSLSFVFTNFSCNYRCYYCYGSHIPNDPGMSLETAKHSIDWLHSTGCRVVAFMGGEPLLRKEFLLEASRYASARGMYVYIPTNGVLLDETFIEQAAEAGVDCLNLAVDCVHPKPGLPKALDPIRSQYEMLLEHSRRRDFLVMFNVNITPRNLDDVRELTEIARRDRINIDFHIVEPPLKNHPHFSAPDGLEFQPEDWEPADALFDWLREKCEAGYNVPNSPEHFTLAKRFIRGEPIRWNCTAGSRTLVIEPDGRLMPCFEQIRDEQDWGRIGEPRFDPQRLDQMKQTCSAHCISTCNFTSAYYGSPANVLRWVAKYYRVRS